MDAGIDVKCRTQSSRIIGERGWTTWEGGAGNKCYNMGSGAGNKTLGKASWKMVALGLKSEIPDLPSF